MSELNISANITEINDGPYYQVKLNSVPRKGEFIKLYSVVDVLDKKSPSTHFYEVVNVVHDIHDVTEREPRSKNGAHFVTVYVKPSKSKFFKLKND